MEKTEIAHGWTPAEIKPPLDQKVLVFTRWGTICDRSLHKYLRVEEPMFSPDALKPGTDVLWWAPIPEDGWRDFDTEKPQLDTWALTKDIHGSIHGGKWCYALSFQREPEFHPFYGKTVRQWREMPSLPPEAILKEPGRLIL